MNMLQMLQIRIVSQTVNIETGYKNSIIASIFPTVVEIAETNLYPTLSISLYRSLSWTPAQLPPLLLSLSTQKTALFFKKIKTDTIEARLNF